MDELLPIELPIEDNSIIKVLGVGGGGCNAVNYLYRTGVQGVSFLVCNTDRQALDKSPIPAKLQLGPGLGAGGKPEKAEAYAEESRDAIREALSDGTQMLFLTAGQGGGTGTGASPIVAEVAQELGILTVAIVTIPFLFEGKRTIMKALRGVAKLATHVDAILVINNEKLKNIYPDFDLPNAFDKSDEVVGNAAKAIAEIITVPGYINTDFQDVYNTLKDGGVAIMNVGRSKNPEERITTAIREALNSPLVNTNDVHGASRILMVFYCSHEHAIRMQELEQINKFIDEVGDEVEVKWGTSYDDTLGEEVRVTIIATGYQVSDIPGIEECQQEVAPVVTEPVSKPSVEEAFAGFYGADAPEKKAPEATEPAAEETVVEEETEEETTEDTAPKEKATIETPVAEEDTPTIDLDANEQVVTEPDEDPAVVIAPEHPAPTIDFDLNDIDEQEADNTPAWQRRR